MTSANFNEVQNKNEFTDEGVKGDLISSTLGGKRPAPSAAEGGSSENEVSPESVTTTPLEKFIRFSFQHFGY